MTSGVDVQGFTANTIVFDLKELCLEKIIILLRKLNLKTIKTYFSALAGFEKINFVLV